MMGMKEGFVADAEIPRLNRLFIETDTIPTVYNLDVVTHELPLGLNSR